MNFPYLQWTVMGLHWTDSTISTNLTIEVSMIGQITVTILHIAVELWSLLVTLC